MSTIPTFRTREEILFDIMQTTSRLYSIRDKDILLERILTEARQALNADAGSIYLVEGTQLGIHYGQNATLQTQAQLALNFPCTPSVILQKYDSVKAPDLVSAGETLCPINP